MSRLFISHSSVDNDAAIALRDWLWAQGFQNEVFLDVDPARGFAPGIKWREALKSAADRCEGVLVLISPAWLASRWCRNEFDLARILHKPIFALVIEKVSPDALPAELTDEWQICNLVDENPPSDPGAAKGAFRTAGLELLRRGLNEAGLGTASFPWPPPDDPKRQPYRGLKALEPQDAAIFFGREASIVRGLDRIRGLSESGVDKILVVLGASGSGKSSFLRAGLWPRLLRNDTRFLPLPVVRPQTRVISGSTGLAVALAGAFERFGVSCPPGQVKGALSGGVGAFGQLLDELRRVAIRRHTALPEAQVDPTIVISLDQAEELFNPDGAMEATTFLDFLSDVLVTPGTTAARRILVIVTIRSDRYELLQSEPRLTGVRQDPFNLPPIPAAEFKSVIEGPARRVVEAGGALTIDPALTERLISDAHGADALPLLAFTLERLYADYGTSGRLTVADYTTLGGVQGSIEAAVAGALADPTHSPSIPAEQEAQLQALRAALIPWLARIHPETGEPMRRVARLAEIPGPSHAIVERLISARLLVTDRREHGNVIEVAHESLLRQWPALTAWLAEDRNDLQLLSRLEQDASRWNLAAPAYKEDLLLPQGIRLTEAEDLILRRPALLAGEQITVSFIRASVELNARHQNEINEARRQRLRQARFVAVIMSVLTVISILSAGVLAIGVSNVKRGIALAVATVQVKLSHNPLSLSEEAAKNLITDVAVLRNFLRSKITGLNTNLELSPWTVAEMAVALEGERDRLLTADELKLFMERNIDRACSCWRETADKMPHTVASSWIMYALARYGIPPVQNSFSWLLTTQKPDGWWAMFPATDDKRNASTSATAWAVRTLNEMNVRDLLSPTEKVRAIDAIQKAVYWLEKTRLPGQARWKEYPEGQEVDGDYAAVSALTLDVLRRINPGRTLASLASEWLRGLPDDVPGLFDNDQSKGLLYLNNNTLTVDEVRHYHLPLMLVATTDSFAAGSAVEKAAGHLWMNAVLRQPISLEQIKNRDWIAGELLIAFRYAADAMGSR
jgi:hypothetical protein